MTDAEIDKIRDALKSQPEWMQVSFEVGILQGCRLTETAVPWHRIDLDNDRITLVAKGRNGKPHEFTTKIHPGLKPLLRSLKARYDACISEAYSLTRNQCFDTSSPLRPRHQAADAFPGDLK